MKPVGDIFMCLSILFIQDTSKSLPSQITKPRLHPECQFALSHTVK